MMKLNKRGFTLFGLISGLLLATLMISLFTIIQSSLSTTYNGGNNATVLDQYNYAPRLQNISNATMDNSITDPYTVLGFFTTGSIASVKSVYQSTDVLALMFTDLYQLLPIGGKSGLGVAIPIFLTIIGLAVILIIVSAIFRYPLL